MEIKLREKFSISRLTGIITNLKTVFTKTSKSPLKIYDGMAEGHPHANSRELKAQVLDVELKNAQALAEFHRKRLQIY